MTSPQANNELWLSVDPSSSEYHFIRVLSLCLAYSAFLDILYFLEWTNNSRIKWCLPSGSPQTSFFCRAILYIARHMPSCGVCFTVDVINVCYCWENRVYKRFLFVQRYFVKKNNNRSLISLCQWRLTLTPVTNSFRLCHSGYHYDDLLPTMFMHAFIHDNLYSALCREWVLLCV